MDMDTLQEIGEKIQGHLVEETGTRQYKQYKLLLPPDLSEELQQLAKRKGMSMADLIRYSIKLYITIASNLEPGAKLIIQQKDKPDQHIIIV